MRDYRKGGLLYEGKGKKVFSVVGQENLVWLEFKDSLTAFNALKKGEFGGKGAVNCEIASIIFQKLAQAGVESHFVEKVSDREMLCKKLEIIPLEVVIRNRLAGSTAKKLGIEEGRELKAPLLEYYFKNDSLADPFVSEDQILVLDMAGPEDLKVLRSRAFEVNGCLRSFFQELGFELIDFKLEFGKDSQGRVRLADEITPDSCRLWDLKTREKFDKDRFRRDLGGVEEAYREVLRRMRKGNS